MATPRASAQRIEPRRAASAAPDEGRPRGRTPAGGRALAADRALAPANRRRALALAAFPAVVVLVVVFLVLWAVSTAVVAIAVAVGVAVVVWAAARLTPAALVVRLVGAVPTRSGDQPRVHNLLDGLCLAGGVPRPAVLALDDERPDVLLAGVARRRAFLVVTTGLVAELSRVELEAVLAHELSHIKSGTVEPATVAVTGVGWLALVLPAAGRWLDREAGTDREVVADLGALSLTRYPPALAAALHKVARAGGPGGDPGWRARLVGHLWLSFPAGGIEARAALVGEL